MGAWNQQDRDESPYEEDPFALSLPGREEDEPEDHGPDTETGEVESVPDREREHPSEIRKMNFDDEDEDDDYDSYLVDDTELQPEETYVSQRSRRGKDEPKSPFQFGTGLKVLAGTVAAIFGLVVLMALFGGGGEKTSTGPSDTELAAANQAQIEKQAKALMEERLAARQAKLAKIRAAKRAKAKAEKEREAELAAIRRDKAKQAEKEAAAAEESTATYASEPAAAPAPTYTYSPPAPAPEPAPEPEPVVVTAPAPVETQADVNQSTASQSFGFGG